MQVTHSKAKISMVYMDHGHGTLILNKFVLSHDESLNSQQNLIFILIIILIMSWRFLIKCDE